MFKQLPNSQQVKIELYSEVLSKDAVHNKIDGWVEDFRNAAQEFYQGFRVVNVLNPNVIGAA